MPSWELTYPTSRHFWVDDVPFPQVGYVSSLEGISIVFPHRTLKFEEVTLFLESNIACAENQTKDLTAERHLEA